MLNVRNLSQNVTESHLREIFAHCGIVGRVTLAIDAATGMSKGHAQVEYASRALASEAIEVFHGGVVDGLTIRVSFELPDPPSRRPGGERTLLPGLPPRADPRRRDDARGGRYDYRRDRPFEREPPRGPPWGAPRGPPTILGRNLRREARAPSQGLDSVPPGAGGRT